MTTLPDTEPVSDNPNMDFTTAKIVPHIQAMFKMTGLTTDVPPEQWNEETLDAIVQCMNHYWRKGASLGEVYELTAEWFYNQCRKAQS